MELEEFKNKRKSTQQKILKDICDFLGKEGCVAIHQFGSFARGNNDELSDLDLWFTFKDKELDKIISKRDYLFTKIGKVIIKDEAPQNAPLNGKYTLIIYEIDGDLYHVDYYLSALSKTIIRTDAVLVWGDDSIPRGEWILDKEKPYLNTPSSRIDFIICMSFIGIKYVVRGKTDFMDFLVEQYYNNKNNNYPQLKKLDNEYNLHTIHLILISHFKYANKAQRAAINIIIEYLNRINKLYF